MSRHTPQSPDKPADSPPRAETDERFPSGEWTGFWLQSSFPGRQWMKFSLQFFGGRITGEGQDIIGKFIIQGRYSLGDGRVHVRKHYIGRHVVNYDGANQNDGKWLWGLWTIGSDRGGFHIWPAGEADPTGSTLRAAAEIPAGEQQARVVLEPVLARE